MHFIGIIAFLWCIVLSTNVQAQYKSLCWKITAPHMSAPSFLYGTMHIQDQRVFNLKPAAKAAFESADVYAMELNPDSIDYAEMLQQILMEGDANMLPKLLNKRRYKYVQQYFSDSLAQPLFLYNKLPPIYTSQLVTLNDFQRDHRLALDLFLCEQAKDAGKRVVGLEKLEEQTFVFSCISYKKQAKLLYKTVKQAYANTLQNEMDDMLNAHLQGDLDRLLDVTYNQPFLNRKVDRLFETHFLTQRNTTMVQRMLPLIKQSSAFIAVGAAHLGGEKGIIQLLREKGFEVVPVF